MSSRIHRSLVSTAFAISIAVTSMVAPLVATPAAHALPCETCPPPDPEPAPAPAPGTTLPALTVRKAGAPSSTTTEVEPGTGFRMESTATLTRSGALAGKLDVMTHTWSTNVLFGFTGGAYIVLRNQDGAAIGVTQLHTFGVNAKTLFFLASSSRYDPWTEYFDPRVAAATTSLEIVQQHTPSWRLSQIQQQIQSIYDTAHSTCQYLHLCN